MLAQGRLEAVRRCLGRHYRLVAEVQLDFRDIPMIDQTTTITTTTSSSSSSINGADRASSNETSSSSKGSFDDNGDASTPLRSGRESDPTGVEQGGNRSETSSRTSSSSGSSTTQLTNAGSTGTMDYWPDGSSVMSTSSSYDEGAVNGSGAGGFTSCDNCSSSGNCSTTASSSSTVLRWCNGGEAVAVPLSCCCNQPPGPGVYQCQLQLHLGATAQDDLLQLERAAGAAGEGPGLARPALTAGDGREGQERGGDRTAEGKAAAAAGGEVSGGGARDGTAGEMPVLTWSLQVEVTDHEAVIPAGPFWEMLNSSSSNRGLEGIRSSLLVVLDMEHCVRHICPTTAHE